MRICFWENILERIFLLEYIFVHWNFCANLNDVVLTSSTKSICFCADMRSGLLLILKDNHSFKNLCTCGWGVDILLLISSASAWSNLLERKCYELGKYTKLWKIAEHSKNGQRCYSCLFLAEKTGAACFVKRGVLCGRWINKDIFISIPIIILKEAYPSLSLIIIVTSAIFTIINPDIIFRSTSQDPSALIDIHNHYHRHYCHLHHRHFHH